VKKEDKGEGGKIEVGPPWQNAPHPLGLAFRGTSRRNGKHQSLDGGGEGSEKKANPFNSSFSMLVISEKNPWSMGKRRGINRPNEGKWHCCRNKKDKTWATTVIKEETWEGLGRELLLSV